MPDTDSELRREWKAAERQLSSRDEASRRAAEVRLDYLRRRWDDLVIRKQRGELTDATRTDELRRIIETAAKWHGLKTNQRLMEGTRNEFEVAERWSLYVAYTGDLSEFNSKRWQAFIDEVKAAVKGRNYVRSMGRSCTFNEFELPPGLLECIVAEQAAVRESSSSAEVTAEADKFRREQYAWTVDVVMWEGPPRRSSTRR